MAALIRRLNGREKVLAALLLVGAALLGWRWLGGTAAIPAMRSREPSLEALPPVERIGLARLERPREVGEAGKRNLFAFGAPPVPDPTPAPVIVPVPRPATPAPAAGDGAGGLPGAPALPPLNVRYIGSVENASGAKVAVLVTDRQEVLTGQPGQVIANRYRVARIGLESVDLEDVSTGQSRRVPLRGGS